MSMKIAGGAMGGVALPIIIEFGAKGARIHEKFPYKYSGVIGTGLGFFTGVLPAVWKDYPLTKGWERTPEGKDNKNMLIAFGAADFATGVSILILDELKKRAGYEFQRDVPINMRESPRGLQVPPEEMIKEI